jgi:adenylosuccinate synthase
MRLLIVLSGPVGVGKTSFGKKLIEVYGATRISTRQWMQANRQIPDDRHALQLAGDGLDRETGGAWVADAVAEVEAEAADDAVLLLDSARIAGQITAIRSRWGERVFHVHLHANDKELERRYLARQLRA